VLCPGFLEAALQLLLLTPLNELLVELAVKRRALLCSFDD
jgi:hypothetical protein